MLGKVGNVDYMVDYILSIRGKLELFLPYFSPQILKKGQQA